MAKSQKVIFAHSLVNSMGAIGDRALAPMFLHPLQYGGRNLGKAYYSPQPWWASVNITLDFVSDLQLLFTDIHLDRLGE